MSANMYDQAAEAQFMNTYVPINFGELFRIGTAQKQDMDRAAEQFTSQLQKFGEFRSPSSVDTKNYYDLTINRDDFQQAINQMVSNPDYLKDVANRSQLQSLINSVDYSTLSNLKQSSENLTARQRAIAQMKAQGKYNPNWDNIDINQWDTIGNKRIMTELAPLEWVNANQLSNAYFDNLKPSTLDSVYKNGVKYQRQGIIYNDLKEIADAKFNDLVATPQGQMYYRDALKASGGDVTSAKEMFTTMIADSQRDRIVELETVDPYWLATIKSGSGQQQTQTVLPTRQQMIEKDWSNKVYPKFGNIPEAAQKEIQQLIGDAKKAYDRYQNTKSDKDYINYLESSNKANEIQQNAYMDNMRKIMKDDFYKVANFKLTSSDPSKSKEYSRKGYIKGVKYSLDEASSTAAITKEDPLLISLGATYTDYAQQDGQKVGVYQFNSSDGFILPETVFQFATGTGQSKPRRDAGLFRSSELPFKELVESGKFNSVQFIPATRQNVVQVGENKLIKGKLRVPVKEVEENLGTGILRELKGNTPTDYLSPTSLFARQSTKRALDDNFGINEIKYGENGIPYYEVDIYRQLPSDNNGDYWYQVNQLRENSPSNGGVGGSTQAQGMQEQSVRTIYDLN